MAAIENPAVAAFLDSLAAEAEKLRAQKARLASLVNRAQELGAVPNTADVITRTRPDADSLVPITGAAYADFVYALGVLKGAVDAIPDATIERFCVRSFEVAQ